MKTLILVFKSGVTVEADKVSEWSVGSDNGNVVSLTVIQHESAQRRVIVKSICLSSIDCIMEVK